MDLSQLIDQHKAAICASVVKAFPPLYGEAARADPCLNLRPLLRRPLGGQADAIRATALSLRTHRGTVVVGEQGCGKSYIGAAAAHVAGFERVLVMAPPHLTRKWQREIKKTVPGARTAIARSLTDLDLIARTPGSRRGTPPAVRVARAPLYVIVSRERAKLGYRWLPCAIRRPGRDDHGRLLRDEAGGIVRVLCCPRCYVPLTDEEGIPLQEADLAEKRRKCDACAAPLWSADRTGPRRYPLADYLRQRLPGLFQLFIADECFPGWARIQTPGGLVLIRDIRVGDDVVSYRDGELVVRRVVRTIRRPLFEGLVRVTHSSGSFVCTPNHKIYTQDGYVEAGKLASGTPLVLLPTTASTTRYGVAPSHANLDEAVSDLREHVPVLAAASQRAADVQRPLRITPSLPQGRGTAGCETHHSAPRLAGLPVVQPDLQQAQEETHGLLQPALRHQGPLGRSQLPRDIPPPRQAQDIPTAERCLHPYGADEPGPRHPSEGGGGAARADVRRPTWWKRAANARTGGATPRALLADGVRGLYRAAILALRGRGPRTPRTPDRYRVRWGVASDRQTAESRQAQGSDARATGLDHPPVLEQRDLSEPGIRPEPHSRCRTSEVLSVAFIGGEDEFVYDLEVEDTHCYFAEGVLVSNCHELKSRGSAQGLAAASLAEACEKTLALSGTIFGGYSSTLFHLLRRFSPAVRNEFGYRDEPRWISRYGIVHRITKRSPDAYTEDGRQSKRRNYITRIVEKPGIAPSVLFHLLPNCVFLRLADVDRHLPPYSERVVLFPLDRTERGELSQAAAYCKLATALISAVRDALAKGSKRLLATYLQTLLSYPDGCISAETVLDKKTGNVIASAPALPSDTLYPKEQALLDLVREQRRRGRRVVVYLANTDTRDLTPRLKAILEREGIRVAVLKANTVKPERREEWLGKQVEAGAEVLLCHPKLVQTGLDLLDWATYVFYQLEYSIYVMRQASRRGWRIGQKEPVEVYHFAYEGTLQADGLALNAAKLRAAVLLDGDLPEDGLAALDDDGEDVFLALARRLTQEESADTASLEALFAQAQRAADEDGDLLVDDGWFAASTAEEPPAPEPALSWPPGQGEPVELLGTGSAARPSGEAQPVPLESGGADWGTTPQLTLALPAESARPEKPAGGRMLTFGELERLVRRPRQRRRAQPDAQLTLFDDIGRAA